LRGRKGRKGAYLFSTGSERISTSLRVRTCYGQVSMGNYVILERGGRRENLRDRHTFNPIFMPGGALYRVAYTPLPQTEQNYYKY
jgi:hypothetical protein